MKHIHEGARPSVRPRAAGTAAAGLLLLDSAAQAHFMPGQHGTLNIVDDGAYLVLSVPVSAFDGVDDDAAASTLVPMTGSYRLTDEVPDTRPATDLYPLGTFSRDWVYAEGSGDLDECNGHVGVTPEFPGGIYHYFATDSYPYMPRCVTGEVQAGAPGGAPREPPPGRG